MTDCVIFDLETSGLNSRIAEIIEISALKIKDKEIIDTFSSLVKPCDTISPSATAIHGITDDMVSDAPALADILPLFHDFIENYILVGYNISSFDLPILRRTFLEEFHTEITNSYIDILYMARECLPFLPNRSLTTVSAYFGISPDGAHRALNDCYLTYECYKKLLELNPHKPKAHKQKASHEKHPPRYSGETKALQTLQGFLLGIIADDILTESEVFSLKKWLDENKYLAGHYPFDRVFTVIQNALADGILEQSELDEMLTLFKEYTAPTEKFTTSEKISELSGTNICLTGDFKWGSRKELERILDNLGYKCQSSVSGKTDYVIVGELGSSNWAQGSYGSKIKKALELQEKGKHIQIVKEGTFIEILQSQGVIS